MKESARFAIAGMLVICSGAIYYFVSAGYCSLEWRSVVDMIVGALIANMTAVVQYYFGSSDGSRQKTELISKFMENGS